MHETPIDAVSLTLSPIAALHWTAIMACEVGCLDVGTPSQYSYDMQQGLEHHAS